MITDDYSNYLKIKDISKFDSENTTFRIIDITATDDNRIEFIVNSWETIYLKAYDNNDINIFSKKHSFLLFIQSLPKVTNLEQGWIRIEHNSFKNNIIPMR